MGKSIQVKQNSTNEPTTTNDNVDTNIQATTASIAASAAETNDENCFLNPTLAAFNFGNLFYCNFCGFSANNTSKILHHLFIHVFKCSSCNHFTYTKYDLMKHIYKYHRPNKELKIKRLVLEVTSNDWYFLCSENDPHSLTSAINEDFENNNNASNKFFNVNNSSDYKSIDTSSTTNTGSTAGGRNLQHTRLVQSNQISDDVKSESKSNKHDLNKKPVTNFFLPKVQKSPEKLTQVIQSNRNVSNENELNNSNTSDTSVTGASGTGSATSQLKKLMNKDTTNPTSKIIIPTINTMKMNSTQTNTATSQTSQTKSISALINTPTSTPSALNTSNQKLMVYMESAASSSIATNTPSLASNKPKRQIKKPITTPEKLQIQKAIKKPKKYTDDSMFSSETKKDLESIKNKYLNMKCKYSCKQCNYEVDDAVSAYSHIIKTNDAHTIKCCACDIYSNDNVCSYKMHLLSKHKFYASADKLFHEFFEITNLDTGEKIILDTTLNTLVAAAIAAAKANEAVANASKSAIETSITSSKSQANNYDAEKITTLKRALIDANIIVSPTSDSNESLTYKNSANSQNKKMRFIIDDGSNSEKALSDYKGSQSNDENDEHRSQQQQKVNILNQAANSSVDTVSSLGYDIEVLDNGSTIYICSKCKLVFLKTNLLAEHKCFTGANLIHQTASNIDADTTTTTGSTQQNSNEFGNNDDKDPITQIKNEVDNQDKTDNLLLNDDNKEIISTSNQNDDYDIIKNNSDIIYIE